MTAQFDDFFTPTTESAKSSEGTSFDDFFTPTPEPSRLRSLASAFPKGLIKGAQSFSPLPKLGPVPEKLGLALTEQFLPTQKKLPEELLERGGKLTTFLAGGEGTLPSKALRGLAGVLGGQTVKEFGGGEIAQDIAELSSLSLPDLAKSIPGKKAQEKVLGFLRKKGFSENEIAPLLNSPKKLARFGKFASKGEKTNKLMRDIYGKFDNVYEGIREEGQKVVGLSDINFDSFEKDFYETLDKIPKFYKRQMKEEIEDLANSQHKFSDLVDFYQAINARIGPVKGGKAVLGTLKEPIEKGLQKISPELAADYKLANELYSKRINVAQHLRTKEIDDLVDLGETWATLAGIADQNLGILTKVIGATGARTLAREILINPKLQNLSLRMRDAIKKNKIPLARKTYDIFRREAIKENPEFEEFLFNQ